MIIAGIVLIFISTSAAATPNPTQTEIELSATKDAAKAKIKTTSGGIILVAIGGLGAILLLIKIPVQWVIYRPRAPHNKGGAAATLTLTRIDMLLPELSAPEEMPVLLWWLVKDRAPVVHANPKEP
ncbi:MAG: hypothetical protein QOK24_238 [Verrucomicrobiota bacterium]|jgi:hypothetical protein